MYRPSNNMLLIHTKTIGSINLLPCIWFTIKHLFHEESINRTIELAPPSKGYCRACLNEDEEESAAFGTYFFESLLELRK